jgi:hypothetical protein
LKEERIGIGVSTLHEWRSKKFFPEPKRYNRALWFNEKQVLLLENLKEFSRAYGKKPWKIKLQRLEELVASISANWDQCLVPICTMPGHSCNRMPALTKEA